MTFILFGGSMRSRKRKKQPDLVDSFSVELLPVVRSLFFTWMPLFSHALFLFEVYTGYVPSLFDLVFLVSMAFLFPFSVLWLKVPILPFTLRFDFQFFYLLFFAPLGAYLSIAGSWGSFFLFVLIAFVVNFFIGPRFLD
jgi:hypothetical protein